MLGTSAAFKTAHNSLVSPLLLHEYEISRSRQVMGLRDGAKRHDRTGVEDRNWGQGLIQCDDARVDEELRSSFSALYEILVTRARRSFCVSSHVSHQIRTEDCKTATCISSFCLS